MSLGNGVGEAYHEWTADWNNLQIILAAWKVTLDKLDKWNFPTVRLALYEATPDFAKYDAIISYIVSRGYKVILDFHNGPNMLTGTLGSDVWINYWKSMATYYKDNPNVVAFELLNEPFMSSSWDGVTVTNYNQIYPAYKRCTDAVRAIDPTRTVIWGDPFQCNLLPGFGGGSDVLSQYLPYAGNMYFSFHQYPPLNPTEANPYLGVNMLFGAMNYVKGLGFRVWLGEFGCLPWFTYDENFQFTLQCINRAIAAGIDFSLWGYSNNDEYFAYPTFYDDVLAASNYVEPPPPSGKTYVFDHWVINGQTVTQNPMQLAMTTDVNVLAVYIEKVVTHTLIVQAIDTLGSPIIGVPVTID